MRVLEEGCEDGKLVGSLLLLDGEGGLESPGFDGDEVGGTKTREGKPVSREGLDVGCADGAQKGKLVGWVLGELEGISLGKVEG